jgi:hypothetical protein
MVARRVVAPLPQPRGGEGEAYAADQREAARDRQVADGGDGERARVVVDDRDGGPLV